MGGAHAPPACAHPPRVNDCQLPGGGRARGPDRPRCSLTRRSPIAELRPRFLAKAALGSPEQLSDGGQQLLELSACLGRLSGRVAAGIEDLDQRRLDFLAPFIELVDELIGSAPTNLEAGDG